MKNSNRGAVWVKERVKPLSSLNAQISAPRPPQWWVIWNPVIYFILGMLLFVGLPEWLDGKLPEIPAVVLLVIAGVGGVVIFLYEVISERGGWHGSSGKND